MVNSMHWSCEKKGKLKVRGWQWPSEKKIQKMMTADVAVRETEKRERERERESFEKSTLIRKNWSSEKGNLRKFVLSTCIGRVKNKMTADLTSIFLQRWAIIQPVYRVSWQLLIFYTVSTAINHYLPKFLTILGCHRSQTLVENSFLTGDRTSVEYIWKQWAINCVSTGRVGN